MMPDREKVVKELHDARRYLEDKEWSDRGASPNIDAINNAIALLKEYEAVVRCRDCKYGEPWGVLIGCGTTKGFGITHKPDWFCADGERKEDKLRFNS